MNMLAGPISVDEGKYIFYIPENDYRIHILRYNEPWVILEKGSKAIATLLWEVEELQAKVAALESGSKIAQSLED